MVYHEIGAHTPAVAPQPCAAFVKLPTFTAEPVDNPPGPNAPLNTKGRPPPPTIPMPEPAVDPHSRGPGGPYKTLGQLLRSHRKGLGLTLDELAARVGRAKSYLSQLENDRRRPPRDVVLIELERALDLPPGTLLAAVRWTQTHPIVRREVSLLQSDRDRRDRMLRQLREIVTSNGARPDDQSTNALDRAYRSGELRALVDRLVPPDSGPAQTGPHGERRPIDGGLPHTGLGAAVAFSLSLEVPVINRVAAGYPREFTDLGYPARVADEYVRCPDLTDPDAFAARVVGESMSPNYAEGDIVIFSPAKPIKDGCDCFVRLEPDHETTFKRIYSETDQAGHAVIRLQPLNSAFPPRTLRREQVAAMFAAVNVIKKIV